MEIYLLYLCQLFPDFIFEFILFSSRIERNPIGKILNPKKKKKNKSAIIPLSLNYPKILLFVFEVTPHLLNLSRWIKYLMIALDLFFHANSWYFFSFQPKYDRHLIFSKN